MNDMVSSKAPFLAFAPEHWNLSRVKFLADKLYKGSGITKEDVLEDGNTPCVRYGEIYSTYNQSFTECRSKTQVERIDSPRFFEHNDILFAGTGELIEEIGKSVVYIGEERCMAGGDIIVMHHSQEPRFLNYLLNCAYVQAQKSHDKYKLKVVHISDTSIGNMKVYMPDLREQTIIADYLDSKCAAIDEAIERHKIIIEKLEEYRQSIIAFAVRNGIDPNARMKDSGLPWIGQIPEHWTVKPNKYIFSKVKEIVPEYTNENILSLTLNGVIVRNDAEFKGKKATSYDGYQRCYKGNLLMCLFDIDVTPRCVGLINDVGITSPAYTQFRVNENDDPAFYYYYYLSLDYTKTLLHLSKNIRNSMTADDFGRIYAVEPPKEEQQAIAAYLREKCQAISQAIERNKAPIKKLEEYRKSIIYQAVTGKIDCWDKA